MLKPNNELCFKFKYQLKPITISRGKNTAAKKKCVL